MPRGSGRARAPMRRRRPALGMTPGARRRGGGGETIRFVTVATPLGWALGRRDRARGLPDRARRRSRPARGDGAAALPGGIGDRRRRRPERLGRPDRALHHRTRSHARPAARHPRHRVSDAGLARLAKDPARPDRDLFARSPRALGQPKAVRAVAQACAANNLALLVPCHRVIREDGDLAGYRWGLERKRALLERERAAAAADEARLRRRRTASPRSIGRRWRQRSTSAAMPPPRGC